MKKALSILLALAVLTVSVFALAACGGKDTLTIAVPNDTTNEARALILLQENGIIKLKDGAGITATINDIVENPLNISFKEVEAAHTARIPTSSPSRTATRPRIPSKRWSLRSRARRSPITSPRTMTAL